MGDKVWLRCKGKSTLSAFKIIVEILGVIDVLFNCHTKRIRRYSSYMICTLGGTFRYLKSLHPMFFTTDGGYIMVRFD